MNIYLFFTSLQPNNLIFTNVQGTPLRFYSQVLNLVSLALIIPPLSNETIIFLVSACQMLALTNARLQRLGRVENAFYVLAVCNNNTVDVSGCKQGQITRVSLSFTLYILETYLHR